MITYIRTHKLLVAGIVAVLAVPLLALAWWLGSPLFIDDAVDEQFPLAAMAEVPDTMSVADADATMVAAAAEDGVHGRRPSIFTLRTSRSYPA